ncbi:hypothetical protein [Paracnuella aquatica]|uniref:hypothetical protein n=1 Tax=Paracnuella aquatica TaxID=2268757 RepID=UPI000DEF360D|nr:hypothetical protein [Paracnuella aquatica]RPD44014.1 hypothetical protein DRJ53_18160 [Paracnuella aquatica]
MKKLTLLISTIALFYASCSTKELSKEEATQVIRQQGKYPKAINYDIYCSDPSHAKKAIDAGLEKEGLVSVQRTQKLGDVGKSLIQFTAKAQSYLLATPEKDKSLDVQKVKIADEDLSEVTSVQTENDGKGAVVEYTTAYKNITPFSPLNNNKLL